MIAKNITRSFCLLFLSFWHWHWIIWWLYLVRSEMTLVQYPKYVRLRLYCIIQSSLRFHPNRSEKLCMGCLLPPVGYSSSEADERDITISVVYAKYEKCIRINYLHGASLHHWYWYCWCYVVYLLCEKILADSRKNDMKTVINKKCKIGLFAGR